MHQQFYIFYRFRAIFILRWKLLPKYVVTSIYNGRYFDVVQNIEMKSSLLEKTNQIHNLLLENRSSTSHVKRAVDDIIIPTPMYFIVSIVNICVESTVRNPRNCYLPIVSSKEAQSTFHNIPIVSCLWIYYNHVRSQVNHRLYYTEINKTSTLYEHLSYELRYNNNQALELLDLAK